MRIDKSECENEIKKMKELRNILIQNIDAYISKTDSGVEKDIEKIKQEIDDNDYKYYKENSDEKETIIREKSEDRIHEIIGNVNINGYKDESPIFKINNDEIGYKCEISYSPIVSNMEIVLYSGGLLLSETLPVEPITGSEDDYADFDRPNVYQHTTTYTDRVITISDDDDTKVEVKIYDYNSSDIERGNHDYYYPGSLKLLESKTFNRTTDKIKDHLNFEEKGKAK